MASAPPNFISEIRRRKAAELEGGAPLRNQARIDDMVHTSHENDPDYRYPTEINSLFTWFEDQNEDPHARMWLKSGASELFGGFCFWLLTFSAYSLQNQLFPLSIFFWIGPVTSAFAFYAGARSGFFGTVHIDCFYSLVDMVMPHNSMYGWGEAFLIFLGRLGGQVGGSIAAAAIILAFQGTAGFLGLPFINAAASITVFQAFLAESVGTTILFIVMLHISWNPPKHHAEIDQALGISLTRLAVGLFLSFFTGSSLSFHRWFAASVILGNFSIPNATFWVYLCAPAAAALFAFGLWFFVLRSTKGGAPSPNRF